MASTQRKAANDFSATFPAKTVRQWRQMVDKWQVDPSCPNPYVSNDRGRFFGIFLKLHLTVRLPALKLMEVQLRLTREEVADKEHGQHAPHKISASVFIRMGLELEDQQ